MALTFGHVFYAIHKVSTLRATIKYHVQARIKVTIELNNLCLEIWNRGGSLSERFDWKFILVTCEGYSVVHDL